MIFDVYIQDEFEEDYCLSQHHQLNEDHHLVL
jgi:hypothetical protein